MLFQITAGDFSEDLISTNDKEDDPRSEVSPMSRSILLKQSHPVYRRTMLIYFYLELKL